MRNHNAEADANEVDYATTPGISLPALEIVTRAVLRILRSKAHHAYIDGISDSPWPQHVQDRVTQLHQIAATSPAEGSDPLMGIRLDLHDDEQFEIFADLAPHAMHSEVWASTADARREWQLFATDDSGTHASFTLNDEEQRQLADELAKAGLADAYAQLDA